MVGGSGLIASYKIYLILLLLVNYADFFVWVGIFQRVSIDETLIWYNNNLNLTILPQAKSGEMD